MQQTNETKSCKLALETKFILCKTLIFIDLYYWLEKDYGKIFSPVLLICENVKEVRRLCLNKIDKEGDSKNYWRRTSLERGLLNDCNKASDMRVIPVGADDGVDGGRG